MKLKHQVVALATMAALGSSTVARAGFIWPGDVSTTTTTLGAGVAVVVWLLVKKKPAEGEATGETTKAAYLYLRDNHLQLTQDLAVGQGPVLDELASAANVSVANKAAFAKAMQANAAELIALTSPESLDEQRAVRFIERYVQIASDFSKQS